MKKYHIGQLIKHWRKQKGMTQEDLAGSKKDISTVSRLERGISIPSKKTLNVLFERLGIDPSSMITSFLSNEEIEMQKLVEELDNYISISENKEAARLIAQLENTPKFIEDRLNKQYLLKVKAQLAINLGAHGSDVLQMLDNAIHISHRDFTIEKIQASFLSTTDTQILTLMAIQYFELGEQQKAADILYGLKHNMETRCIDKNEMGRRYPHVIVTLTNVLLYFGKYDEIIELCAQGRSICIKTGYLWFLPSLAEQEAEARVEIGDYETAKSLLKSTYHTYLLHGKYLESNYIKKYAQEKLRLRL